MKTALFKWTPFINLKSKVIQVYRWSCHFRQSFFLAAINIGHRFFRSFGQKIKKCENALKRHCVVCPGLKRATLSLLMWRLCLCEQEVFRRAALLRVSIQDEPNFSPQSK